MKIKELENAASNFGTPIYVYAVSYTHLTLPPSDLV